MALDPAAAIETSPAAADAAVPSRSGRRQALTFGIFLLAVVVIWELAKAIAGVPWRIPDLLGSGIDVFHDPPLRIPFVDDVNLPHVWDIVGGLFAPFRGGSSQPLLLFLAGEAAYTWGEALAGFVVGAALGLGLAIAFVHSGLMERAFVPYVIASQTVPIVALAPMIVFAFGQTLTSVILIATYLTFFPVTIAGLRGLRSSDPRALELMRSYAATRGAILRKVRLPASMPYLFTAFKIAATASLVGAIIGESAGGVSRGLGSAIQTFNQQYVTGPERLWGAIIVSGAVGVLSYLLVRAVERRLLRGRPDAAAA